MKWSLTDWFGESRWPVGRFAALAFLAVVAAILALDSSRAAAELVKIERHDENALLRVDLTSYRIQDEKLGEQARPGSHFLVVRGTLTNRSADKAASVPPARDAFFLILGDGSRVDLDSLSEDTADPVWASFDLAPGEARPVEMVFVIRDPPPQAATLVHPAQDGVLRIPVIGEGLAPATSFAAGPVDNGLVSIAATNVGPRTDLEPPAPPASRYLQVGLRYENLQRDAFLGDLKLADYVALVEDGRYVYPVHGLSGEIGSPFAAPQTFVPNVPLEGPLVFQIPRDAGGLTLVHFTPAGPLSLDLTPDGERAATPAPIAGPSSEGTVIANLLALSRRHADGEAREDGLVLDLELTLNKGSPEQSFYFDPEAALELHDGQGRIIRPSKDLSGLRRALRPTPLWRDQPTRGEVAFPAPRDASNLVLVIPFSDNPVRLAIADDLLPPATSEGGAAAVASGSGTADATVAAQFDEIGRAGGGGVELAAFDLDWATEIGDAKASPGHDLLIFDLEFVNRSDERVVDHVVAEHLLLVDDGQYTYEPHMATAALGSPFSGDSPIGPGRSAIGFLIFEVPASAANLALRYFGPEGVVTLPLTPPSSEPSAPVPAGPAQTIDLSGDGGTRLSAMVFRPEGPELLATSRDRRYVVADLALKLESDDPLAVLPIDPTDFVLRDEQNRAYSQVEVDAWFLRPFRATKLWNGQTSRGQLAFLVPTGEQAPKSLTLEIPALFDLALPYDPGPPPKLSISARTVDPGAPLVVRFENADRLADDAWLGIFSAWLPHGDEAAAEAAAVPPQFLDGRAEGRVTMRAPMEPGAYEVRLFGSDGGGEEVALVAFTVTGAALTEPAPATEPPVESDMTGRVAASCDLTGQWRTTLGTMHLSVVPVDEPEGADEVLSGIADGVVPLSEGLRGTIVGTLQGRTGQGWVDGAVIGDRVQLRWYLPESYAPPGEAGDGYFDLSGDCDQLSGAYRMGFEGDFGEPWAMRRITGILDGDTGSADDPFYQARTTQIARVLTGVRDALDATRYDLDALAAALSGADDAEVAEAALAVMNNVAFAPYAGVLRGAGGTLLAESGNAYDQSLMLAALLEARGIATRLVGSTLTAAAANRLVAAVAESGPRIGGAPAFDEPALTNDELSARGLTADDVTARLADLRADRDRMLRETEAEASWNAARIIDSLPSDLATLDIDAGAMRQGLVDRARDHVWVQANIGGAWRDLDPVYGDRGDANRLAGPIAPIDRIDDGLYHRVNFIISVERLDDGALTVEEIGAWTVRVADIMRVGAPIFRVRNVPFDIPSVSGAAWTVDTVREGMLAIHDSLLGEPTGYRPVLMLSTGEMNVGTGFDLSGELLSDDFRVRQANQAREAISGGLESGASVLENLFGDSPSGGGAAQSEPSVLTGQWLEVQWVMPADGIKSERRAIFDRIGPAARAAGDYAIRPDMVEDRAVRMAMLGGFDLLVTGGPIGAEWRSALRLDAILANESAMNRALDLQFALAPLSPEFVSGLVDWPDRLYRFDPLLRAQAIMAATADEVTLIQDAPHIVALRRELAVDGSGHLNHGLGFDIVNGAMAAVPRADTTPEQVLRSQLAHGARQTVLEREMVAAWAAERCAECTVAVIENAATIMAAALDNGGSLVAVEPGSTANLPAFADDDVREAAAGQLRAGNLLVLPAEPVVLADAERAAWWRIDPATGDTLGLLAGRGGEGYAEYIIITGLIIFGDNALATLGMFDQCIDFDPGPGSLTNNGDGTYTWRPPTGPSWSGRGLFNCMGCALLAFTCPYDGFDCWTSYNLYDFETCRDSL